MTETCGVFSNGTVCMTSSYYNSDYSSAGSYESDYENCSDSEEPYNPNNTCIKGYTKTIADEMVSKGAACHVGAYGDADYVKCNMNCPYETASTCWDYYCQLSASGYVVCSGAFNSWNVNPDGTSFGH